MSRPRFVALVLALITLLAYLPVTRDRFLNLDDDLYVTSNHIVQNGLTWAGTKWAFTTLRASHFHPLTWLSHMLDCELFGLNAGAQHYVNVLFHTANAVLLLLLLFRLTGALWPSALAAALFAWHPLLIESVAWVAQRKNVLSTFFGLLTLLAYVRYAEKLKSQSPGRKVFYGLALVFFALGLMSKPMLVTLPFVMLLLDYWPLARISNFEFQISTNTPGSSAPQPALTPMLLEKWPFFLLAALSGALTFMAQRQGGFVPTLQQLPLDLRLGDAVLSYTSYLGKIVWPANLAVLYPLPGRLPWAGVAAAAVFLAAVTWLAWRVRRRCPYLFVGWLWFFGMLLPVSGLVQDYGEAFSDRFLYVPIMGVFIAFAFGCKDLVARFQIGVVPTAAVAAFFLGICLMLTEHQLSYWRNDETLFGHAIAVTTDNCIANNNLGVALAKQGRRSEALARFQEAIRLNPGWADVHNNLGNLLRDGHNPEAALAEYRQAAQLNPNQPVVRYNLGEILAELGRYDEARSQLNEAARLDPGYAWPHFEMGRVLLQQGRDAEAIDQFREALRRDPNNFQFLVQAARVLAADEDPQGRDGKTALRFALHAYALTGGGQPEALDALGMAFAETGDFTNAQAAALKTLQLATTEKITNLEPLQRRLELYQRHQPWRESFLSTNPPPQEIPKN